MGVSPKNYNLKMEKKRPHKKTTEKTPPIFYRAPSLGLPRKILKFVWEKTPYYQKMFLWLGEKTNLDWLHKIKRAPRKIKTLSGGLFWAAKNSKKISGEGNIFTPAQGRKKNLFYW